MTDPNAALATALKNAGLWDLAERAARGEFGDFTSPHATPKMILAQALADDGTTEAMSIRAQVIDGDYDG